MVRDTNDGIRAKKAAAREENLEFLKRFPQFISNTCKRLNEVANVHHAPRICVYLSFWLSMVLFGQDPDHYIEEEHYRLGLLERSRRLSYHRLMVFDRLGRKNATWEEISLIDTKNRFVKEYAEFIGRETMYIPEHTDDEVKAFIERHGEVMAKPVNECGGKGVHKVKYSELTEEKLKELRDGACIIEELIIQHPDMARINPSSVNTVRMITIIGDDGEVHIFSPFIRAGMPGSVTDNTGSGGIEYPVDAELGIVTCMGMTEQPWVRYLRHPGTDTVMPGFKIPNYDKACALVKAAALKTPFMRYIGWDVAITKDGAVIIESNTFPGTQEVDGIAKWKQGLSYFRSGNKSKNNQSEIKVN